MKDTLENKVIDNYKEHPQHDVYDKNCSSCWSENLMIKQSMDKLYRQKRTREEIITGRNRFTDSQISPNPLD